MKETVEGVDLLFLVHYTYLVQYIEEFYFPLPVFYSTICPSLEVAYKCISGGRGGKKRNRWQGKRKWEIHILNGGRFKTVIIVLRFRQQLDLMAERYILILNKMISQISHISTNINIYKYIYTHTYTHVHIYIIFVSLVEVQMLVHNCFVD